MFNTSVDCFGHFPFISSFQHIGTLSLRPAGLSAIVRGNEPTEAIIVVPSVMICFSWEQEIVIFIGKLYIVASKVYHCRFMTKLLQSEQRIVVEILNLLREQFSYEIDADGIKTLEYKKQGDSSIIPHFTLVITFCIIKQLTARKW